MRRKSLESRLDELEQKLPDPNAPLAMLVVFADNEGHWWNRDEEIDPATVHPKTRVIVIRQRPDGPQ